MRALKIVCLTLMLVPAVIWLALAQAAEEPKVLVQIPDPPVVDVIPEQPQLPPKAPDAQKNDLPAPAKAPDVQQEEKKAPLVLGDPTIPSAKLKQVLNQGKGGGPASLPNVVLRGRIISKDGAPAAILQVGDKSFIVGKGSILAVPGSGNTTVRVEDINSLEVHVEVLPQKEMLGLR
jgi:hypothetical protein